MPADMRRALLAALALAIAPRAAASPLERAVKAGDAAQVIAQLDQGADLNGTVGQADLTPLKVAVNADRLDMARLLLERGADVNVRRNGTSALSLASIKGSLAMVDFLLSQGAEVTNREIQWAQGPDRAAIVAHLKDAAARQAAAAAAAAAQARAPGVSTADAVSDADAPSYRVGERPDDFALIVAVEKYMDAPAARYAESDAVAVRRHLLALGWPERNVLLLTGERAGRAGLEKYLERWLPNNVNANTRLFFYFAGDGASDPATGRASLLPWDGDPAMLDATGYPLSRLYQKLAAMKVRSIVAVLDVGFSGVGERTAPAPAAKGPAAKLDLAARDLGDVAALLAVSAGESAAVLPDRRHGALTYYLLKGLNGDAVGPHGTVTLKGVFADLRPKAKAHGQTPQLLTGTLGEADLLLR